MITTWDISIAFFHEPCFYLKKVCRVIKFKQEAFLKSYINMNTELKKNVKNGLEKDLQYLVKSCKIFEIIRRQKHKSKW